MGIAKFNLFIRRLVLTMIISSPCLAANDGSGTLWSGLSIGTLFRIAFSFIDALYGIPFLIVVCALSYLCYTFIINVCSRNK